MAKKLFRVLALMLVPFLSSLFIRFLYITNKKKFHIPDSVGDEPVIFACWHGELLMLPYLYKQYRKTAHGKVLISEHFDGLLISKTIKYFGLGTIAGSTNRNATRALIQAIKTLKDGYDIGITPDGPKGPMHHVSKGIIVMAQKTKAKIVLVRIKPTSFWQMNSWDKFKVPNPFGTLNYYATSAIDVSGLDIELARQLIQEGLLKYEI
ncbi:MAG: hypothetical protein COB17_05825 [Sulfurimonas sp.]|nr:MAG: hypothetical protein COB17_05825 [Sulfurimonas sp.]